MEMIHAHKLKNSNENPYLSLLVVTTKIIHTKNKTHGFTLYKLVFGHSSGRTPERMYSEKELITRYIRDLNEKRTTKYPVNEHKGKKKNQKSDLTKTFQKSFCKSLTN